MRRRPRRDVVFIALYAGPLLLARSGGSEGSSGGAETQVFLLARELQRRGRRVAIAAIDGAAGLPPEVEGVEVVALPARGHGGGGVGQVAWQLRLLAAIARLDGAVLVQRGAGFVTGLVALAARARGRRFVYSSASMYDFDLDRIIPRQVSQRLFRLGTRLARTVVVQSEEQAELCRRRWGRQPTVIRSLAEPAPLRRDAPEAFLWIGRLAPYKRPDAFAELAARVPQARFQLLATSSALDPEAFARMRARARDLPNLDILAPRSRSALALLYDRAVAVVSTSELEGMPNILLEAWARGVPALVLSHDPDGLIARHRLGWCAGGSADRLVELVEAAWSQRADQAAIAARCRAYLEREHAPAAIAERWEHALELSAPAA